MTLVKRVLVMVGISVCLSCLMLTGCDPEKTTTTTIPPSAFTKLSLDVEGILVDVRSIDSEDVVIKVKFYGDSDEENSITYLTEESGEFKFTYKNGVNYGFLSSVVGHNTPKRVLTIELPRTVSFDMEYNIKYGEINLSDIDTDKALAIKTDNVKVNLENVNAQEVTVYSEKGKLHMENVNSKTIRCGTDSVTMNFTEMNSDDLEMAAEYGSITGDFVGNSDDYTVTGHIKDGKSNLSDFEGTGSKNIAINGENARVNISFAK